MVKDLEKNLSNWYREFDQNHDQLREQLLARLRAKSYSPESESWARPSRHYPAMKWALAAAAVLMILLSGLMFYSLSGPEVVTPQAAWAAALENVRLQSVHFVWTTPGAGQGSSLEMWWRRPHEFRMEFSNGLLIVGNQEESFSFNRSSGILTRYDAGSMGFEWMALGELGELFISDETASVSKGWIRNSNVIGTEEVQYKGEPCHKIVAELDERYYVYIISAQAKSRQEGPLLYQVDRYEGADLKRLLSHVEVLKIDSTMPDSLFRIDTSEPRKIINRRTPKAALPGLSEQAVPDGVR